MCTISVHPERPSAPLRMHERRVIGTVFIQGMVFTPFGSAQDERSLGVIDNPINRAPIKAPRYPANTKADKIPTIPGKNPGQ
ncbi:hypothetical protein [Endozoicomonas sp. ALB115]